jgi:AcrR family transcriptional regulator/catechol 2,3-dioxygenase-like lactoylglutathione lyase family enzyme
MESRSKEDVVTAITPYLIVRDADAAIAFYAAAFGAKEEFRLVDKDLGKVGHADLSIGETHFMLADDRIAIVNSDVQQHWRSADRDRAQRPEIGMLIGQHDCTVANRQIGMPDLAGVGIGQAISLLGTESGAVKGDGGVGVPDDQIRDDGARRPCLLARFHANLLASLFSLRYVTYSNSGACQLTVESPPARGRPRSEAARKRILAAARLLLQERGLAGLTVEGIAAIAKVGKPTIYRQWPNAQAVAMDAFLEGDDAVPSEVRGATAIDTLRRQLQGIASAFTSPAGRSTAAMIAAAQNDSELAKVFRHRFILRSRETGRDLLRRAIDEGAVRADADVEVALDLLYAPLFFRLLIGHGKLDGAFTDALLDQTLRGLQPARAG